MAFRITTNGLMRSYRTSLGKINGKVYDTMERVQTTRNFSTSAEDPAAASKAFQLRRSFWRAQDHIDNTKYLMNKIQMGWTSTEAVVDGDGSVPSLDGIASSLSAISDTTASGRPLLGRELIEKSESIVMCMNVRYNDEFVFAGIDGMNVPFSWGEDGALLYRGVDVSATEGTEDYEKLQKMATETGYVDVGLGLEEDENGDIVDSSAFNSAISGIEFLGYGLDEDGEPQNLAVLMNELGNIFQDCDRDTGAYADSADEERAQALTQKLLDAISRVQEQHVALSSQSEYLQVNLNHLEETQYTLNTEISELEQMDPALAVTEMYWAQYCYQAALKIGNDLVSQTLFDYLK
ncbi:MAG: hypothetical protein IJR72_00090 [Oscillospiraceae bacterium]|nr:hypothetical protein [Oscillospiraceae bacterium]